MTTAEAQWLAMKGGPQHHLTSHSDIRRPRARRHTSFDGFQTWVTDSVLPLFPHSHPHRRRSPFYSALTSSAPWPLCSLCFCRSLDCSRPQTRGTSTSWVFFALVDFTSLTFHLAGAQVCACLPSSTSVTSHWWLETSHGGSICTRNTSTCCKSRLPPTSRRASRLPVFDITLHMFPYYLDHQP